MSPFLKERLPYIAGAVISVLLQLIAAPYICIGYAMPDFILCYVIVRAALDPSKTSFVSAFILGLIYDLASSGAVGPMALICAVLSFGISYLYMLFDNDTLFIPIALVVLSCFIGESAYAILTIACGTDVGLAEAFIYRVLPCALYDTFISVIVFVIWRRINEGAGKKNELTFIR